jgi:hypothetical protein
MAGALHVPGDDGLDEGGVLVDRPGEDLPLVGL